MKKEENRRGGAVVEAALLFPLIVLLLVQGVSLMFRWYEDWEREWDRHQQSVQEEQRWGNEQLIRWKQGKLLWKEKE